MSFYFIFFPLIVLLIELARDLFNVISSFDLIRLFFVVWFWSLKNDIGPNILKTAED